jgi:hypothetical protein
MDPHLAELLEMIVVFGSGTVVVSLWLWFRHAGRRVAGPRELERLEGQLREIQQSVDAIAVEVERVSEGQRFTTKLLSERVEGGAQGTRVPPQIAP